MNAPSTNSVYFSVWSAALEPGNHCFGIVQLWYRFAPYNVGFWFKFIQPNVRYDSSISVLTEGSHPPHLPTLNDFIGDIDGKPKG